MKISKPIHGVLKLESNCLFIKIIGTIFFSIGLVLLFYMSYTYQLNCNEDSSKCTLSKKVLFFKNTLTLSDLNSAKIRNRVSKKGNKNYYLQLKTSSTLITLNSLGSPTKENLKKWKKKINQYIENPLSSLEIGVLYPMWFFLLPVIFLIVSSCIIIIPKKVVVTLSSNDNKIIIKRTNLLAKEEQSYPLNSLKEITLQEMNGNNGRLYRILFQFKTGEEIPLSTSYDNLLSSKLKAIAQMSLFLNLPMPKELEIKKKQTNKLAFLLFFLGLCIIGVSIFIMNVS